MKYLKQKSIYVLLVLALMLGIFPTTAFAAQPVTATIPVEKILTGDRPSTAADFTFKLTPIDNAPMPASDTLIITGAGTGSFGPITYTRPNDYTYTLTEAAGGLSRYSYDGTVYTVTVRITTDDAGVLSSSVWMRKPGVEGKLYTAAFTNRYTIPRDPYDPWEPPDRPNQPPDPFRPGKPDHSPGTGDTTNNGMWASLLAISGAGMLGIAFTCRKKKKKTAGAA